ncbi:DUF305 domain-containing protein [Frigoribacterium sp. PvP032]|uniref:DUF305 domain-containing protein n=1 Tax=Frigoribacterium sp. PvP032 TaxID=2806589 RepID=UPI001B4F2F7B|nr:DUF305 domain-containing protein [Frigoribacterium sp. PvP032]MBP1190119.1 uncharacterized protein (DUF305 family) [Frigoribacterium sp. PvP032]
MTDDRRDADGLRQADDLRQADHLDHLDHLDDVTTEAGAAGASSGRRLRLVIAAAVALLLVLGTGVAVGRLTSSAPVVPGTNSVEAGFARDMQVHHEQAVEMSFAIRDRSTSDDVRTIAYDIAATQSQQAGQMYAWLEVWGVPQAPSQPVMTWMTQPTLDGQLAGHDHGGEGVSGSPAPSHVPGEPMPGLATPEQMAELRAADGVDAERLFLTLMIDHHLGGIEMAEAVLARSDDPQVDAFASGMIMTQQSDVDAMRAMLALRS